MNLIIKTADSEDEFDQLNRLNYQTFVEEIPQHRQNTDKILIDRFNSSNKYFIVKFNSEIVGMVSINMNRPFSIDYKIENIDQYLPKYDKIVEIRLLSIKQGKRNGVIFYLILKKIYEYGIENNIDLAVISGTVRQLKLYHKIGFIDFYSPVGTQDALYQPMYITISNIQKYLSKFSRFQNIKMNLLPGPVNIPEIVNLEQTKIPFSHRSTEFKKEYENVKKFAKTIGMEQVQVITGSGTLGNDIVANQLLGLKSHGLIIENGEFGKRLVNQAQTIGLKFEIFNSKIGKELDLELIKTLLLEKQLKWIWFVHCETSTGQLNPLNEIVRICNELSIVCAVDAISTVGNLSVNFKGVDFVSTTSGKGLCAFPGLSIVLYNRIINNESVCKYLDLNFHVSQDNVPFTLSSNLLCGLNQGIKFSNSKSHFDEINKMSQILENYTFNNFKLLNVTNRSPAVFTYIIDKRISSIDFGNILWNKGLNVNYKTQYLQKLNAFQVCFMGDLSKINIFQVINTLKEIDNEY